MEQANFELIKKYAEDFELSNLREIVGNSIYKTTSENTYEHLEPWIQWTSFYTGLPYAKHKAFHLGDYRQLATKDVFASIDKLGKKSGYFFPMNHPGTSGSAIFCQILGQILTRMAQLFPPSA